MLIIIGAFVAGFAIGVIAGIVGTNIAITSHIARHFGW
jgi:hypothetical protein